MISNFLKYFFLIITCYSYSQENNTITQPTVDFPATPKVAALAKYADSPVSYYSGTPNINIPIHIIEVSGYQLPVSLNYHASGIKVAQEASNVGLGWSLNAGGVITRQIRGFSDFNSGSYKKGYFYNGQYYNQSLIDIPLNDLFVGGSVDTGSTFSNTSIYNIDLEPDIFFFNFNGYSGKFIIQRTGLYKGKGLLIDGSSNIDIEVSVQSDNISFRLTSPDGITYDFSTTEKSKTHSWPASSYEDVSITPLNPISWYLDKITLINNQNIDFNYTTEQDLAESQVRERHVYRKRIASPSTGGCPPEYVIPNAIYYSKSESTIIMLNSILWNNGKIEFNNTSRNDYDSKKVSNIYVFDSENNQVKTFNLDYSYFNDHHNLQNSFLKKEYLRLKLTSIKTIDYVSGAFIPPYRFTYYEDKDLASKTSNRYDFWGYQTYPYTGTPTHYGNEPTRIPSVYFNASESASASNGSLLSNAIDAVYNGVNRKPDFDYAVSGTLKSMQQPTSGIENYKYELNKHFLGETYIENQYNHSVLFYYGYNNPFVKHEGSVSNYHDFTINGFADGFTLKSLVGPGLTGYFDTILALYSLNEDGTENEIIAEMDMGALNYYEWDPNFPDDTQMVTKQFNNIDLIAGNYRLRFKNVNTNQHVEILAFINYTETTSQLNTGVEVGGLRIKSIESQKNNRIFGYTYFNNTHQENLSSGILLNKKTQSLLTFLKEKSCYFKDKDGTTIVTGHNISNYLELQSDTNYPLTGLVSGNVVGYSQVTEEIVSSSDASKNIKTVYNYHNEAETPNGFNGPNNIRIMNGKLKSISEYWKNQLDFKTELSYENYSLDFIEALGYSAPTTNFDYNYFYGYEIPISWVALKERKKTSYFASVPSVETKEIYKYNDPYNNNSKHRLPISKIIFKSDDNSLVEKYYYPEDASSFSDMSADEISSVNTLISNYQVNNLLQKESFLYNTENATNTLLNTSRISYKSTNGMVLPNFYKTSKAHNQLEDKMQYLKYDSNGNILETLNLDSGVYTSYIWSYKKSYLVAKVENARFIQLSDVLGKTVDELSNFSKLELPLLENLRISENLNKAMITTYKYKELIGIQSIKDPRGNFINYHYDAFNRLEYVTDSNGNVLSKNEYYYKQQ